MDARRHRLLAWAAYGVAAILVLFPLVDSILGVWPPRLGDVQWRFGALGLFSRALMTPTLGILMGVLTAVTFHHRARLMALSGLAFIAAATCLGLVALFVLDASQARTQVVQEVMAAFDTASAVAITKYLLAALLLSLMGLGGWGAARHHGGKMAPKSGKGPGLVVDTAGSRPFASNAESDEPEPSV